MNSHYSVFKLFTTTFSIRSRSSCAILSGGDNVKTLLNPATVAPFFPMMTPCPLHAAMTAFTFSTGKGSFETLSTTNSIPINKPLPRTSLHLGDAVILVAMFQVLQHQFP